MNRENDLPQKVKSPDQSGTGSPAPTDLDARIYMAAEHTFFVWIRTDIAFMGFGFVVARFGLFLRELTIAGMHSIRLVRLGWLWLGGSTNCYYRDKELPKRLSSMTHHDFLRGELTCREDFFMGEFSSI